MSSAVYDALAPLYDDANVAVAVISAYDGTFEYVNKQTGEVLRSLTSVSDIAKLPVDLVGRSLRDVFALYGIDYDSSSTVMTITTGQRQCQRRGDYWAASSILPLSDGQLAKKVLSTQHGWAEESDALRSHEVIAHRVAIAIEFCEAERLIQVGMEALHRARQHLSTARDVALLPTNDIII